MADKLYEENSIKAIADAIRSKNGSTDTYTVAQMAAAIEAIESGGGFATGIITLTDTSVDKIEITHGLGVCPDFVIVAASNDTNWVYSRNTPLGQSFIYVVRNPANTNWYYLRQLLNVSTSSSLYNTGAIYGTSLSTGARYYCVINEQTFIWANRDSKYGFGEKPCSFIWVAVKELSI